MAYQPVTIYLYQIFFTLLPQSESDSKGIEDLNGAAGAQRIISWNITLRCPLKCSHCYVDAGKAEAAGVLSTQKAFSIIACFPQYISLFLPFILCLDT
jgi:hypothetical protein